MKTRLKCPLVSFVFYPDILMSGRKIEFAIWFANKANLAMAEFATIAKVAMAEFAHSQITNLEFASCQIFQKY